MMFSRLSILRAFSIYNSFAAKSLQSCLTLCDPIDGSPLGSSVSGIFQARIMEWVAISFSNAWKWKVKVKSLSQVWLFRTPWNAAYQAPPSMGFSRQEYWSGGHCLLRLMDQHPANSPILQWQPALTSDSLHLSWGDCLDIKFLSKNT